MRAVSSENQSKINLKVKAKRTDRCCICVHEIIMLSKSQLQFYQLVSTFIPSDIDFRW